MSNDTTSEQMAERRHQLETALSFVGVAWRDDSKLLSRYVDGTLVGGWTLDEIAGEMALMRWLREYTDYSDRLERTKRSKFFEMKKKGVTPYEGIWHDIYDMCEPKVRKLYRRPPVWPWFMASEPASTKGAGTFGASTESAAAAAEFDV